MPIRFRCAYCNQLMGIARRKAGNVVTCPKCTGQIVVPTPESTQEEERFQGNPAAVFEEDDEVQKLLEFVEETQPAPMSFRTGPPPASPAARMPPATVPASPSVPQPAVGSTYPADVDVVPLTSGHLPPQVPARGLYLTPGVMALLLGLGALLVGLAFLLGFL